MKFAGIVSGHHGGGRYGELVIFDTAKGRHEAGGVVQRIPGYGKEVPPVIQDRLITNVWPKFLQPWPLSEKYLLVSCKLTQRGGQWGIYLVDVFDNLLPVLVLDDAMLFEPVPLREQRKPPAVAPRVNTGRKDAVVFLTNIYLGPGLKGIPRGTVKRLRLLSYHFAYLRSGGHASVGVESGWDIKRILGSVPVEEDGSAIFRVPANTPIAVQPLDEEGRALQLMRSWFVGMPGEVLSCVGCHEATSTAPPSRVAIAAGRAPSDIEPWYGPARPFGFTTEVRPVLDRYCVGCHNGEPRQDGKRMPDFSKGDPSSYSKDVAYMSLHPYVRRPGSESDYHVLRPMEYHASTSELVRMLEKGHHNVKLDREAWQRLYTWIDFNVPHRGSWSPPEWRGQEQRKRRLELAGRYASITADPEGEYASAAEKYAKRGPVEPVMPEPLPAAEVSVPRDVLVEGWPFDAAEAGAKQAAAAAETDLTIELGTKEGDPPRGGDRRTDLKLRLVPAGEFVMGAPRGGGDADERPLARVRIDEPFWMGIVEVTNAQYALFDPVHDSRFIDQQWKDHALPGYPANLPDQPVIRVSWREAVAFCGWLSAKTGRPFTLPTEAQWEWACRAGTGTPFWYGGLDGDFSKSANLADQSVKLLAVKGVNPKPVAKPNATMDFVPRDARFNDGAKIVTDVGSYRANAWGLLDMHGNVAEWTRSTYRPYPYDASGGRDDVEALDEDGSAPTRLPASPSASLPGEAGRSRRLRTVLTRKVARGGSWRDRPKRARSASRIAYEPYQKVFNVGFRVVCPAGGGLRRAQSSRGSAEAAATE